MADLSEQCLLACDELIDVTGRAAIEALLQLSASQAAGGPAQQGKRSSGDVVFYGRQLGHPIDPSLSQFAAPVRVCSRGRTTA